MPRKKLAAVVAVRTCRKCGCTDDDCRQCIERTGEPCRWVEADLCSACADAWRSTSIDALEISDVLNRELREIGVVFAGDAADWLDYQLTPERTARRLRDPRPRHERAIGQVRDALRLLRKDGPG